MSDFQLRGGRPLDEQVDNKPTSLELEHLQDDLSGAVAAEGEEKTAAAVEEVLVGNARPQELMAWIDDIRTPDRPKQDADEEVDEEEDADGEAGEADPNAAFAIDDDLMGPIRKRKKRKLDEPDEPEENSEQAEQPTETTSKKA